MSAYAWAKLNKRQLGRYAEYFVKMEFTLAGVDIFTPEIDDKGIDFVAKSSRGKFWEVQVKSILKSTNIYLDKQKFDVRSDSLLLALVRFIDDQPPKLLLIPSQVWLAPNTLFVGYDRKDYSEWGVQLGKKNEPLLLRYAFEEFIGRL